ncbi:MAG: glycosyl hydrolase [Actinomycetota bacterium]
MPKTKAPNNGQTVSGRIMWRVKIRGTRPKRVHFAVDGRVKTRKARPRRRVTATIDTTKLSNGRHTLTAIAYRSGRRRPEKTKVKVRVANPANGPGSVYWGAHIGSHLTGTEAPWDMNAAAQFEEMAGRQLSILHFYSPFSNCSSLPCSYYDFPSSLMETVRQHGSIPMLSWASNSLPGGLNQPDLQLSDVIAGNYDSYIRSFAERAKSWGHPFFLRFNFEMNGDWFAWSESVNGNGPGQSVAAWRHVHDIFTSVGATNATWVWCPNADPNNTLQDLGSLYPGDGYVDWTCMDGYNWGMNPSRPGGWETFAQVFNASYHRIADTIAPSKPMMIAETGSTEYGGSKADWTRDALTMAPSYPKIRALVWYENYADGMDWPIETSQGSTGAFASGIQNSAYTTNSFGDLGDGPIPPPGA